MEHPEVPVISFTGSTETGSAIGETCGRMHKRLSLEMGGKNAMIVMDDADLDLALEGCSGGRSAPPASGAPRPVASSCTAGSTTGSSAGLADAAERLRLGDGRDARHRGRAR